MARFLVVLTAITLAFVPFAAPADAADGVDLDTLLRSPLDEPVPDSPVPLEVVVENAGTSTATNVVLRVPIPAGVTVVSLPANCSVVAAVIVCTFPSIAAGSGEGLTAYLTFAVTGAYVITSSASGDQPDLDGDSTDRVDVNIVSENADLIGQSASTEIVIGTQPTARVFNDFINNGPTAVGNATVSGAVTGGVTIVPGSFNFFLDYLGTRGNVADDQCTVTATTFTCAPVFSGGVFYAVQPF